MNLTEIKRHVRDAETAAERLSIDGALNDSERHATWMHGAAAIGRAAGAANEARVKSEEQQFVRELVVHRCDQLTAELMEAAP